MKVLSAKEMREADAYTISHEPVSSFDLMWRAATKCCEWIRGYQPQKSLTFVCGPGNNGGDGLCIAAMLKDTRDVTVFVIPGKTTADFEMALSKALGEGIVVNDLNDAGDILLSKNTIVVDAIFGTGLNKPVSGKIAGYIDRINESGCEIISIDIPSGLFADTPTEGFSIHADHTLTFQSPKLAFFFPENEKRVGTFHILNIDLHQTFIDSISKDIYYITPDLVRKILLPRARFSHKGTYGKSLMLAGSHGKMGAAVLAARACLRSGTGLLTLFVPRGGYAVIQSSVPEAMCMTDEDENNITRLPDLDSFDAVGAGPGIGTEYRTCEVINNLTRKSNKFVLDADALNILSMHRERIPVFLHECILTPHPGEFERLAGKSSNNFERLELQKTFSEKHNCAVVLKGAHTSITLPGGRLFFNSTGNPGMAKGGSGDALTGMILAFLAQGYTMEQASVLGVFIHGMAGDLAAAEKGEYAMICSDLIEKIPAAFNAIG